MYAGERNDDGTMGRIGWIVSNDPSSGEVRIDLIDREKAELDFDASQTGCIVSVSRNRLELFDDWSELYCTLDDWPTEAQEIYDRTMTAIESSCRARFSGPGWRVFLCRELNIDAVEASITDVDERLDSLTPTVNEAARLHKVKAGLCELRDWLQRKQS